MNRFEQKLDKIIENTTDQRERLAKLETKQSGMIKIFTALWSVVVTFAFIVIKKLHIL